MSISRSRRDFLSRRLVVLTVKAQKQLNKEFWADAAGSIAFLKARAALDAMQAADEDIERCRAILRNIDGNTRPFVVIATNIRIAANTIRKPMFQASKNRWTAICDKYEQIQVDAANKWGAINRQILTIQAELNQ